MSSSRSNLRNRRNVRNQLRLCDASELHLIYAKPENAIVVDSHRIDETIL